MTETEYLSIKHQLTMIKNLSIILRTATEPIEKYKEDFNCPVERAVENVEKAYNFLKKYGVNYLETAYKTIKEITDKEYKDINNTVKEISKAL